MLSVGDTFLVSTAPYFDTEHLFIIIAIEKSSNSALMVNVTSHKGGCDESCVLNIGDHPFVTHRSVINYADARIANIDKIAESIASGSFKGHYPVSSHILERIQQGGLSSSAISFKCHYFLSSNIEIQTPPLPNGPIP